MEKSVTEEEIAPWTLEAFSKKVREAYSTQEFYELAREFYGQTLKRCSACVRLIGGKEIQHTKRMLEDQCKVICHIIGKEEYHQQPGFNLYLSSLAAIHTAIEMGYRYNIDLMPRMYLKLLTRLFRYSRFMPEAYSSPITLGMTNVIISRAMRKDSMLVEMRDTERSIFDKIEDYYEKGLIGDRCWAPYDERVVLETYAQRTGISADAESELKAEANSN